MAPQGGSNVKNNISHVDDLYVTFSGTTFTLARFSITSVNLLACFLCNHIHVGAVCVCVCVCVHLA